MFKYIRVLLITLVVLSIVAAALPAPSVSAAQFPYFNWVGKQVDCSQPAFAGAQTSQGYLFYDYYLPEGHTLNWSWVEQWSPYYGGRQRGDSGSFTAPGGVAFSWSGALGWFWVDWNGGYVEYKVNLVDPSGTLVVAAEIRMDCDGGSWTAGGSIWDPQPPDPSIRREGTIVDNTFVYGLPDPATAVRSAVLTIGQMWFVIGRDKGPDGAWWYNVYISGSYGWVPASSMVLNRPFEEGDEGEEAPDTTGVGTAGRGNLTIVPRPLDGGSTPPPK